MLHNYVDDDELKNRLRPEAEAETIEKFAGSVYYINHISHTGWVRISWAFPHALYASICSCSAMLLLASLVYTSISVCVTSYSDREVSAVTTSYR